MASTAETEDAFCKRMSQLVTDSHLCLSVALGVQTGLFEKMAEWDEPKFCEEIAQATDKKERYVREWLGAMVTGKIVELSTDSSGVDRFLLPPRRRNALTRAGATDSSTAYSLTIPALAEVFGKIVNCFKKDGPKGVSYSAYSNLLWTSLGGLTEAKYKKHLVADIIPAVPGMTEALESGASVLDIGCGTGATSTLLAAAFPRSTVLAVDTSDEALEITQSKVLKQNLNNITVAKQDASKLPSDWSGKFDLIFANDMVHDSAQPGDVLRCCYEVLKTDGTFVMNDIYTHSSMAKNIQFPYAPLVYNFSVFHCMPVSLNEDGMGLGSAWGIEKAEEMIRAAGFTEVRLTRCPTDVDAMFVCKKTTGEFLDRSLSKP
ncbi:S-adenosylmethionine-dependent methyltransferase Rv2258c-like [Amphiura filiformis]|uniref:S-adenosylmethionine-dependent methyltransferase Rv2258c-like n=1 Tax=Amphiura filiformis TaxID=82378 RepID=UPI003B21E5D2